MNEPVQYPELEKSLSALRAKAAGAEAPVEVEIKLLAAFRDLHRARKRPFAGWRAPAAVAACLALAIGWRFWLATSVTVPEIVVPSPVAKVPVFEALRKAEVQTPPRRIKLKPKRSPTQLAGAPRDRPERPFIPLPYTPAITQGDRGQVIRVNMPRSTIRSLGLPVNEDRFFERVQADVLMGEDGIARAIRFVNSSTTR